MTELRVIDTYWSDHCRHTTFSTRLTEIKVEEASKKAVTDAIEEALKLYFETRDFDGFLQRLDARSDVALVHPAVKHPWGQRAIRFYDPDCHMIEVGEDMVQVTGRFRDQGMSPTEIARRMDVPEDYVAHCLALLDGGQ